MWNFTEGCGDVGGLVSHQTHQGFQSIRLRDVVVGVPDKDGRHRRDVFRAKHYREELPGAKLGVVEGAGHDATLPLDTLALAGLLVALEPLAVGLGNYHEHEV